MKSNLSRIQVYLRTFIARSGRAAMFAVTVGSLLAS